MMPTPRDGPEVVQAEEGLRREGELLQAIFDALPVMLTLYEPDTRILRVNPAFERVTGWAAEPTLMEQCYPDPANREEARHFMQSCPPVWKDFRMRTRDGRVIEASWTNIRLSDGRQVGIGLDVSEGRRAEAALRESEARYRDLYENANDVLYTLDLEGRVTSINKRGAQTLGYTEAELVGRSTGELVPREYHEKMQHALRRKLAGDANPTTYELEMDRKDGRRITLEVSSRLIVRDGRPVGIQGNARDVTERRAAEKALKEADRRKDEFLAMLGHELRNPLAPIRNGLAVLRQRGGDDPATGRLLGMMERQVAHAVRLIDDLLDVSRVTRGQIELRKERVALADAIARALEEARTGLEERDHRVELAVAPEPLMLDADPVRLQQIVTNLLTNAAKYTPPGGRVGLRAEREGEQVVLRVRDNGIGIRPEMLRRIFELFTQADRVEGRVSEGLGLGLPLVKTLTEMHGGSVEAHSDGPGHGSEFIVRLPLVKYEGQRTKDEDSGRPCPSPVVLHTSHRILVVDDNEDGAESIAMLLRIKGHEVRVAFNGEMALCAFGDFAPRVVLLDIGMPGMTGYEVARRLRAIPAAAEVLLVALTGYGQDEDRRRALEAGFDHHLVKPVDFEVLLGLLNNPEAARDGTKGPLT